ncbi:hypothetical protein [Dactylosporangium sp. NPDC050588]|uniref:hypothetical protein n=1 Tax=Dactylosporangium sp. NPDC050588 TaxID=3157211 RepID=UPI0033EB9446
MTVAELGTARTSPLRAKRLPTRQGSPQLSWLSTAGMVLGTVGVLALTACSPTPEAKGPYAPELKQARDAASSDFERQVFKDLDISRAEYEEAVKRFVDCVKGKGVTISAVPTDGYYQYDVINNPAVDQDAIQESCGKGTRNLIEPIFVDRLRNPNKEDENELFAKCLIRNGVAPADYNAERARKDRVNGFKGAPYDSSDPRVAHCNANPNT